MDQLLPEMVTVLGPTAAGKTSFAAHLAHKVGGEIISADSRQVYRGMDIGTAKPTIQEQQGIPHHLIDVTDPDQPWSLAVYLPRAIAVIQEIQQKGNLPFLVGGTGQYIQAIVQAWDLPPIKPDPRLREALRQWAEAHRLILHHSNKQQRQISIP